MKTLPEEQPFIEQEEISKKIEEMLSVLEKRSQCIAVYRKKYIKPIDIALKKPTLRKENPIINKF